MQKRNIGLDVIKGFAAWLVCMLHLLRVDFGIVIPGETYFPNLSKIIYGLCACSVPLFFFVNGYLVGFRQNRPKQILGKIANLFKLRVVWGIIIGIILCIILKQPYTLSSFKELTFYLWFFEALIIIYAFLLVWDKIKYNKWSKVIPVALFIVPFCTNFIGLVLTYLGYTLPDFFGHTGLFRLYGIFYFILPFYLKGRTFSFWGAIVSVIMGVAIIAIEVYVWSNVTGTVYDGMNACFPTIGALLMTLGFFSLFTTKVHNEKNKILQYVAWLGRNCMGIYIFHIPFVAIFRTYINTTYLPTVCAIMVSGGVITMSALIYSCLLKNKFIGYLLKI